MHLGMDGKRPWQSGGSFMDDNVIELVKNQFDVSHDLAEFEQELKELEVLSPAKIHIQSLVYEVATSKNLDVEVRLDAARILCESSDIFPFFFEMEGGHEILQQIIKEKMRDRIRH